jgi:hypothetical protein
MGMLLKDLKNVMMAMISNLMGVTIVTINVRNNVFLANREFVMIVILLQDILLTEINVFPVVEIIEL